MNKDGIGWKSKGGQSVTIVRNDITGFQWVRVGITCQLRVEVKGGSSYKFDGFRDQVSVTLQHKKGERVVRKKELSYLSLSPFSFLRCQDAEMLRAFFKESYGMELKTMDLCTKGMNWGRVEFVGSTMHFNFDGKRVFEIPLSEVAQSSVPNRNELLMEFHHDDTVTEDVTKTFSLLLPNFTIISTLSYTL
jgi:structure-specific recognition protein 1